ncbi:hypothetical protein [Microcoleus sp. FACHB-672]|uniref:hypothetical protein n=1 Tax=Microcoleus sp. FACHB-672 TaxID=2692825 RepID=UPI0016894172|nr:hypothetical protein [Microcoleus sp. FACHB-672]MBD2040289.1 hypothetical protein [Microcoleus sp. FACHB-672]
MAELLVTLLNSIICLLYIYWSVRAMVVVGKLRLLHLSSVIVVLFNGISIPFLGLSTSIFNKASSSDEVTWIAFWSMSLFIFICSVFQKQKFYKLPKINVPKNYKRKFKANLWFWFFLVIGIFSILRFMIFSNGLSFMGSVFSSLGNIEQYYLTRLEIGEELVVPGRGLGWAVISANYLLPMISFLSIYYACNRKLSKKSQVLYWIIWVISILLMTAFYITLAHRFMIAYLLIIIAFCIFIYRYNGNLELYFLKWKKPYLILSIITLVVTGLGYLFSLVSGSSLLEGIGFLAERTVLIPAGTNSFYYYLFPARFPYRGLLGSFNMSGISLNSNDVGFYDVAEAMTGLRYGANASFIAIGYSGAGLLGVGVVSVVYCLIASCADRLLNRMEPRLRFIGILINLYGIIGLASTPLNASVVSFGFGVSSFIFYFLIKRITKNDQLQQQGNV